MIYIALLRGINVSGHNLIKMADLRQMFTDMGFRSVQTYIQSGNVLFESEDEAEPLRRQIEDQISTVFGMSVPVVLRTAAELRQIIDDCPFSAAEREGGGLYVSLLAQAPSQDGLDRLPAPQSGPDQFRVLGREVYILCGQSYHKSKLTNQFFEQKLRVATTSRNWQTMGRLSDMAAELKT